ncbi:glutathione S-transferase domain-containing protein [Bacillus shivajii]|uniref:glutathione S-transferase N-terminal domain-containing protein n=1 Tax=Bacillus shivajii TaxID=1983719 RepID=UPI001CF9A020|nr:glutathione S-transferase N-terminal domain-containing protein [Bacillus shivajii]UCZ54763.1 glutathione S-transferase domain-containing protein [Bacillus shivajii]
MRVNRLSFIVIALSIFLTGCLYPDERRGENRIPYEDQIASVQSAVIQYRQDYGVLPIKTREADTPIFRKYPVNFGQLIPKYIQSAPGNSFENGGVFQYVLVNPEEIPEVKLIDLTTTREIQEFQRRIQQYRRQHDYAPVKEIVGNELMRLDYKALNYEEEPTISSPFHPNHRLPLLMRTNGDIVVDYSLDIIHYIDEHETDEYESGDDLRWLLVDHSPFVPAYSIPQTVKNNEVIFLDEN